MNFRQLKFKKKFYSFYNYGYWKELGKVLIKFKKINKSNSINDIFYKSMKYQIEGKKSHTINLRLLKKFQIKY